MGRTSFYVIRISRQTLFIGIVAALVISALLMYSARQRHREVKTVANSAIVLDQPAPEFTLLDTTGNEYSLHALQGQGIVLVFWTTWCPNCATTLQTIQHVHGQLDSAEDIALIGINMLEDGASVSQFTADYELHFPVLLDSDAIVSDTYSIRIVPSVIFIDEYGIVRERMLGTIEGATFTARLQSIISDEQQ